jgi:4-carboxymuconolactone decarboxylase
MRLPILEPSQLSERQKQLYDRIAGKRGHVRGPFAVWLHSPELCDKVEALGAFVRWDSVLPERIRELAILIAARFFDAPYSWAAHADKAIAEGVDAQAVKDLAEGRVPSFKAEDERAFYRFTWEFLDTHFVSDAAFKDAQRLFGSQGVVDIVGALGNAMMLAMCLNAFQVELRAGTEQPFPDVRDFRRVKAPQPA